MDKIAVYCGTRNLYPVMQVAAKSLLYHTPVDRVFFMIEDDSVPGPLPDIIVPVNISEQTWFTPDGANYTSPWTYMAHFRLAMAKVLTHCPQVLYLDTDTLVLRDISPLFETDLNGKLFAMVAEDISDIPLELVKAFVDFGPQIMQFQSDSPRPAYCTHPYYNSGVMLMNLAELRATGMDDRMIQEVNTVPHLYPDQDVLNLFCQDLIVPLPQEYNVIASLLPDFPADRVRIKHFASEKPLWKSSLWQQYKRLSWEEVMTMQETLQAASCT